MTKKENNGALGKGLDALIGNYSKEEVVKEEVKADFENTVSKEFDEKIVADILADVNKNPRISLWSAKSAAVLRFLRKTEPEFSISNEASLLIEAAIKEKYPEIWERFEGHI
jgi:hypothetical protein